MAGVRFAHLLLLRAGSQVFLPLSHSASIARSRLSALSAHSLPIYSAVPPLMSCQKIKIMMAVIKCPLGEKSHFSHRLAILCPSICVF